MLAVWLTSFSHGGTKGHEGGNDVLLGVHFDCFFFFWTTKMGRNKRYCLQRNPQDVEEAKIKV